MTLGMKIVCAYAIWILCGFIGYLFIAKANKVVEFNDDELELLMYCVLCGPFLILILIVYLIHILTREKFKWMMDKILRKMNGYGVED